MRYKFFPEGLEFDLPIWVIGERREKHNPVSDELEDAILAFTKHELAVSAAKYDTVDPVKPISGKPTTVHETPTEIAEPREWVDLLVLFKEAGATHVYFDGSYSISIDRVLAAARG